MFALQSEDHERLLEKIPLTVGIYQTVARYRRELNAKSANVGTAAKTILLNDSFICEQSQTGVNLAIKRVSEIGLAEGGMFGEVCKSAGERGFLLNLPEVGPAFYLSGDDVLAEGDLVIAMKPIRNQAGAELIFSIEQDEDSGFGGLWLHARNGTAGKFWPPETRFVFRRLA